MFEGGFLMKGYWIGDWGLKVCNPCFGIEIEGEDLESGFFEGEKDAR